MVNVAGIECRVQTSMCDACWAFRFQTPNEVEFWSFMKFNWRTWLQIAVWYRCKTEVLSFFATYFLKKINWLIEPLNSTWRQCPCIFSQLHSSTLILVIFTQRLLPIKSQKKKSIVPSNDVSREANFVEVLVLAKGYTPKLSKDSITCKNPGSREALGSTSQR